MSDDTQVQSTTTPAAANGKGDDRGNGNGGTPNKPDRHTFSVDGRPYESDTPVLTGAQIKARAGVDPSFLLYLEGRGNTPDQQIADGGTVDLRALQGREQFYSSPPATFGSVRGSATAGRRSRGSEGL